MTDNGTDLGLCTAGPIVKVLVKLGREEYLVSFTPGYAGIPGKFELSLETFLSKS